MPATGTATALIVDDEQLARRRIKRLLGDSRHVSIIGECSDAGQAIEAIRIKKPDIVFLDIQMPDADGFDVIQAIGLRRFPVVVFVTAYDRYALKAFEVHAVDYLLKPFDRSRFEEALQKALRECAIRASTGMPDNLRDLLSTAQRDGYLRDRILVKSAGRIVFVDTKDIDWIESAGNYVILHTGRQAHTLRETMKGVMQRLDSESFIRIHRGTIVNAARISEMHAHFHGDYVVILRDGTRLTLSRRYRGKLRQAFPDL